MVTDATDHEYVVTPSKGLTALFFLLFALIAMATGLTLVLARQLELTRHPVRLCSTASEDSPMVGCHLDYHDGSWWWVP